MSLYKTYVLPRLLNFVLGKRDYDAERSEVAAQAAGVVLEIGAGSGPNIPFYKGITKLYALEPSEKLWDLADARTEQASFPIKFMQESAEKIPLPDHTVDTAVSTWTMCSIPHPQKALQEVRRVLRPGGKFIFVEHGQSPGVRSATWQRRLTPAWKALTGGCHLDRDIESLLAGAGFEEVHMEKGCKQHSRVKLLHYFYKGFAITASNKKSQAYR